MHGGAFVSGTEGFILIGGHNHRASKVATIRIQPLGAVQTESEEVDLCLQLVMSPGLPPKHPKRIAYECAAVSCHIYSILSVSDSGR